MKKTLLFVISIFLCLSLLGCNNSYKESENDTSTISDDVSVKLDAGNISDYVNIQLVFGNVEQIMYEPEEETSNSIIVFEKSDRYLSCMCYIYVTPKADYNFQNASLTLTIPNETDTFFINKIWNIDVAKPNDYTSRWEITILLDKDGYGMTSVRFKKDGDSGHPLSTSIDWTPEVIKASGNVK